jgi:arylsulfatase A-like enzyme
MYVDIDTLNPNHLSCYGYTRKTSPNIDKISEDGVRFENYYCTNAPCLPSRAALVSGMFGIHNGCVSHGGEAAEKRVNFKERGFRNPDDENNLFHVFRKAGMHCASISTFAERHSAWWFNAGFHELYNLGTGGQESGEMVEPLVKDWLTQHKDKEDWFLHFQLWDPHTSIRVPQSYQNPFEDQPMEDWLTQDVLDTHLQGVGPHSIREIGLSGFDATQDPQHPRQHPEATNMKELKAVIDSYGLGVNYADYICGHIFDYLKQLGIYSDMMIIISSDHGENMGDLGIYQEHNTANHGTCHIPFICKMPEGKGARHAVAKNLYYNIDLAPTLADLFSVPHYKKWDGCSYSKVLQTGEEGEGRSAIVISQLAHVAQRAVIFGEWEYIRTYHDGFHLYDSEMLFHLKTDPHEQHDVKEEHKDLVMQGEAILSRWVEKQMESSEYRVDPLQTVMKNGGGPFHAQLKDLPPYLERLRKTGRAHQADLLEEKYLSGEKNEGGKKE